MFYRYVGDILAWLHQVVAGEKELLQSLLRRTNVEGTYFLKLKKALLCIIQFKININIIYKSMIHILLCTTTPNLAEENNLQNLFKSQLFVELLHNNLILFKPAELNFELSLINFIYLFHLFIYYNYHEVWYFFI